MFDWHTHLVTDLHDADYNGVIRASAVQRYMQIAANGQLRVCGPSNEELWAQGKAFLLTAIDITLHRPLFPYTEIESSSCGCQGRGFIFPRYYELEDSEGVVAEGLAQFGLIDVETRKLLPFDSCPCGFAPMELPAYTIRRFRLPHIDEMEKVGTYTVTYGETDQNRHLNNTFYPNLFTSFLDMNGKWVSRMVIRFQKDAPLGETLTVYRVSEGDTYRLCSIRSDGQLNAEAEFTLSDL